MKIEVDRANLYYVREVHESSLTINRSASADGGTANLKRNQSAKQTMSPSQTEMNEYKMLEITQKTAFKKHHALKLVIERRENDKMTRQLNQSPLRNIKILASQTGTDNSPDHHNKGRDYKRENALGILMN